MDSWDKVREQAVAALLQLPTPLPGLTTAACVEEQFHWAAGLLTSPRVREADAGKIPKKCLCSCLLWSKCAHEIIKLAEQCLQCWWQHSVMWRPCVSARAKNHKFMDRLVPVCECEVMLKMCAAQAPG